MTNKKNRNALVHGIYSTDVVLPWEREEDFGDLLEGIRLDLKPNGTTEHEIAFTIAHYHWKKRRIHHLQQLAFLNTSSAAEIEKSGKRSVPGIRGHFKARDADNSKQAERFTKAVAGLTGAVASLAEVSKSGKDSGKAQANLRSVLDSIQKLQSQIDAQVKAQEVAKRQGEKISGEPYDLHIMARGCELQERLDALIEKNLQRLIIHREFQRQYGGHDSTMKVIEHCLPPAQPAPAMRSVGKTNALNAATVKKNKSTAASDGNKDSDYDNDNHDMVELDRDLGA